MVENGFAEGARMEADSDGLNENILDVSVDSVVAEASPNFGWLVNGEVKEGGIDPKSGFDSCRTDVDEGRGSDGSADVIRAGVDDTEGASEDNGHEENGPGGAAAEVIVEESDVDVIFVF